MRGGFARSPRCFETVMDDLSGLKRDFAGKKTIMTLNELVKLIYGRVLTDDVDLDVEVEGACAADLMSDVLASIQPNAVLLTGLCNPQVVRTAQMADVAAIIFVRGKVPTQDIIDLANDEQIPLITAPYGMFELCGRLYKAGLPSLEMRVMRTLDDGADGGA